MNKLTLAVAGGRKTQGIIDACASAARGRRILVLTFTMANQRELKSRLAARPETQAEVHVQGWFSFLMGHLVRPYLPRLYKDRRIQGLNFEGDPGRYATGGNRYLDPMGQAYKIHLAKLALDVNAASGSAAIDRLVRVYDEIYIDEVQDLNGYDLEVLAALFPAPINVSMVGDVRQSLINTNQKSPKNKQFKGIAVKKWFDAQVDAGHLQVEHSATTWRSNQAIADFADAIFDEAWGFSPTTSENVTETGHDGVFAISPTDVYEYVDRCQPMCLRHSAASGRTLLLPFLNFAVAKGQSSDRVLIAPTAPIVKYLRTGERLDDSAACSLYVAVTRARFSVGFVSDQFDRLGLPVWSPEP